MTGPEPACAVCGKDDPASQVLWCHAWDAYLCMWCRSKRNDQELSRHWKAPAEEMA